MLYLKNGIYENRTLGQKNDWLFFVYGLTSLRYSCSSYDLTNNTVYPLDGGSQKHVEEGYHTLLTDIFCE